MLQSIQVKTNEIRNEYRKKLFCKAYKRKLILENLLRPNELLLGTTFSPTEHSWKKVGSQDPGSFDFFGQN